MRQSSDNIRQCSDNIHQNSDNSCQYNDTILQYSESKQHLHSTEICKEINLIGTFTAFYGIVDSKLI